MLPLLRIFLVSVFKTFLSDKVSDSELNISNFYLERKDRQSGKGGGIIAYISDKIPYVRRTDLENDTLECIWLQINFANTKPFLIGYIYRPPNSHHTWINTFDSLLKEIDALKLETLFLGDFNFNFITEAHNGKHFNNQKWESIINKHVFSQIIDSSTRITKHSSSLIDHIYTNNRDVIIEHAVPNYAISDHLPVCCTRYVGQLPKHKGHTSFTYRSYKHFCEETFLKSISEIDFRIIESQTDVNASLVLFQDLMKCALSKNAPIKQKRVKKCIQPGWYNDQIKQSIEERNRLFKQKDFFNYKQARNKTTSLIRKSKINFFNKAVENNQSPGFLWQHLKHIRQTPKQSLPEFIEYNNQTIYDKTHIANMFNEHFIKVSNIIEKSEPCTNYLSRLKDTLKDKVKNVFLDFIPITVIETKQILKTLNTNKSTGLDGIGPKILKLSSDYIAEPITYLINKSLSEGVFPNELKNASVIPIHKAGSKSNPNNYRPISILPTLSKVFERHVASQIQDFLKKYDLIHSLQSGFRKSHSCCTALINLIDNWLKDVDEGKYVGAVFLDLRKAFDLVDHKILIEKLKCYNFSALSVDLMNSYLSNRSQLVKYNDCQSTMLQIKAGVPQGSILGPLLFLIYINDISLNISSNCDIDLYADGSTIHHTNTDINKITCICKKV